MATGREREIERDRLILEMLNKVNVLIEEVKELKEKIDAKQESETGEKASGFKKFKLGAN
jgi:hypothetical protein